MNDGSVRFQELWSGQLLRIKEIAEKDSRDEREELHAAEKSIKAALVTKSCRSAKTTDRS